QHALQPQRRGQVVERGARLELLEEPQALLGEGQGRRGLAPGLGRERGRGGGRGRSGLPGAELLEELLPLLGG
ncbi:MAG: hypothetical protein ABW123_00620, partial [Cystobacter sp.]